MIIGIAGVLILAAAIVMFVKGNKEYGNMLNKMRHAYSDGTDLGVANSGELQKLVSETLGISMASKLNPDMTITIKGKKCIHNLYMSGNLVNIEYPSVDENLQGVKKFLNTFLIPVKMMQIREANNIMDSLVKQVNPDTVLQPKDDDKNVKYTIFTSWGSAVGVLIAAFMLVVAVFGVNDIDSVKNACPNRYPDISYGEAFDNYFIDGQWSNPKNNVVRFQGDFNYNNNNAIMKIQFVIKKDKIKVSYMSINGARQDSSYANLLLEQIFNGAEEY